jgi:hypothetical protein
MEPMSLIRKGYLFNLPEGAVVTGLVNGVKQQFIKMFNTTRGMKTFILVRVPEPRNRATEELLLITGVTYVEYVIWE